MSTSGGPGIGAGNPFAEKLLNTLREIRGEGAALQTGLNPATKREGPSFSEHLEQNLTEVNGLQAKSDRMAMELASGRTGNIHETMLAATQAELAFNLMVQVRNKALEAYTEVMRMPV